MCILPYILRKLLSIEFVFPFRKCDMVKQKQLKLFYFFIYNSSELFKGLKEASLYYG
jgi:hypothetical protein